MASIIVAISVASFLLGVLVGLILIWDQCDRQCEENYERGFADGHEAGAAYEHDRQQEEAFR